MEYQPLEVTDGPSKFDLMVALFDSTGDKPRILNFKILTLGKVHEFDIKAMVQSVSREDGSGESWNLILEILPDQKGHSLDGRYRMYYSTRKRAGSLKLEGEYASHRKSGVTPK